MSLADGLNRREKDRDRFANASRRFDKKFSAIGQGPIGRDGKRSLTGSVIRMREAEGANRSISHLHPFVLPFRPVQVDACNLIEKLSQGAPFKDFLKLRNLA